MRCAARQLGGLRGGNSCAADQLHEGDGAYSLVVFSLAAAVTALGRERRGIELGP